MISQIQMNQFTQSDALLKVQIDYAILKILISSDNHLGYKEDKPERQMNSFKAFEEVLENAVELKADLVLLGGDLFHKKQPSQFTLLKTVEIFQKYVFGDNFGGISLEKADYVPNFSNCNFNIGLPIFAINGNHDDHTSDQSDEQISILDILHQSKYINYFGKVTNNSFIRVKPLIIIKGNIRVAIYGVGYISDYQFSKLLNEGKLILEDIDNVTFNILVVHQNRYKGTHFADAKNFLDPKQFKKFPINLIVWGHEHEAKYSLEQVENFHVFQNGSTVATSLIEAESNFKQSGLLTIGFQSIEFVSIKLMKSFVPMILRQIDLQEVIQKNKNQSLQLTLQEQAEEFLRNFVEQELTAYYRDHEYKDRKPLVRVKIEYTGFDLNKLKWIETRFEMKVANPKKIFLFWKRKSLTQKQLDQQDQHIKQMNENFNQKLLQKEQFNQENEFDLRAIELPQLKVLRPENFETLLKVPIEQLQEQSLNVINRSFYQKKQEEMIVLVKKEQDGFDQIVKQLKYDFGNNFQKEQSVVNNQRLSTYTAQLNNFIDTFKVDLRTFLNKNDNTRQELSSQKKPAISIRTQLPSPKNEAEKMLHQLQKQQPNSRNQVSQRKEDEEDNFFDMIAQNAIKNEESSSVQMIEEKPEVKDKQAPKKRKKQEKQDKNPQKINIKRKQDFL